MTTKTTKQYRKRTTGELRAAGEQVQKEYWARLPQEKRRELQDAWQRTVEVTKKIQPTIDMLFGIIRGGVGEELDTVPVTAVVKLALAGHKERQKLDGREAGKLGGRPGKLPDDWKDTWDDLVRLQPKRDPRSQTFKAEGARAIGVSVSTLTRALSKKS
ncbi:MAG: hypothetical protein ACYDCJ_00935 [Gammaproteobacteria bacterium]